jgi:hypothetical protein
LRNRRSSTRAGILLLISVLPISTNLLDPTPVQDLHDFGAK